MALSKKDKVNLLIAVPIWIAAIIALGSVNGWVADISNQAIMQAGLDHVVAATDEENWLAQYDCLLTTKNDECIAFASVAFGGERGEGRCGALSGPTITRYQIYAIHRCNKNWRDWSHWAKQTYPDNYKEAIAYQNGDYVSSEGSPSNLKVRP